LTSPAEARSRHRWTVLAVGITAQGAFSALHLGLPALAPDLRTRFDLGLAEVGALISAPALGTLAALLAWGVLADRIGERPVLVTGLGGGALALAGAALWSPSALALGGWLLLAGLLGSAANAATGRAVAEWFGPEERGLAMGLRHMSTPLGGGLAALALPALAHAFGLPAAFWALAGAALVAAVASGLALRGRPPRPVVVPSVRPRPFRDRMVWGLSGAAAAVALAQLATLAFMVVYLEEVRGWSVASAAATLAAAQIVGAFARPLAGVWSDRTATRLVPLRVLALVAAGALIALALAGSAASAVAAALLVTAAVASMAGNGVSFAAVAEAAGGPRAGTALGLQNTIVFVAVVIAPPAFGALVAVIGWQAAFGLLALAPLVGAAAYTALGRRQPGGPRRLSPQA
jgi:sugar phosphate permease